MCGQAASGQGSRDGPVCGKWDPFPDRGRLGREVDCEGSEGAPVVGCMRESVYSHGQGRDGVTHYFGDVMYPTERNRAAREGSGSSGEEHFILL